jgi:hypothetical protein
VRLPAASFNGRGTLSLFCSCGTLRFYINLKSMNERTVVIMPILTYKAAMTRKNITILSSNFLNGKSIRDMINDGSYEMFHVTYN